jgi:hypothetical protein
MEMRDRAVEKLQKGARAGLYRASQAAAQARDYMEELIKKDTARPDILQHFQFRGILSLAALMMDSIKQFYDIAYFTKEDKTNGDEG